MEAQQYFEKRKIPDTLVTAVIEARKASEAQKKFQTELNTYIDKCQREKLRPKAQWIKLLQWFSEGREIDDILEALQVHPRSINFLEIFESLKAHGFPDWFLNKLISEISSDSLDDKAKANVKLQLHLNLPQGKNR